VQITACLCLSGKDYDVAVWFADTDFAHAIEGGSFFKGDGVALQAFCGVVEIVDFDKEGCGGAGIGGECRDVFADAFDGLQHEFGAVASEDCEADGVAFRNFDGFFEAHAVGPERKRFFHRFDYQNRSDLHLNYGRSMTSVLSSARLTAFIATKNAARAKAFYEGTLGLTLVSEDHFATVFNANGTTLRVTPVHEIAIGAYTVLGWEVADIEGAVSGLVSQGVLFERFPGLPQDENGIWEAPGGTRVAWFKDPDGNILSVAQR
jgi:catechol 2,3-dioxygenase-like lactoylglutathione lyase family enzyme